MSGEIAERAWVRGGTVCYFHGPEADQPGDFRACLECGHIYRTAEDLIEATHQAAVASWEFFRSGGAVQTEHAYALWRAASKPERRKVDDLHVCPLCTHDF